MKYSGNVYCIKCKQIVDVYSKNNIVFECEHCNSKYCECGNLLQNYEHGYYCSNIDCKYYDKDILNIEEN